MERIYLDTNLLIYAIEGHAEFGVPTLQLIDRITANDALLILSDLAVCECMIGPTKANNHRLVEKYQRFFDDVNASKGFERLDLSSEALEQVPELAAQFGLKLVDAMHLSLALQAGCNGFATHDRGFDRAEDLLDIVRL